MQTQAWLHEIILVVHEHASLMCIRPFRNTISRTKGLSALTKQRTSFHVSFFPAGCSTELPAERCPHDSRSLHIASAGLTFHKHPSHDEVHVQAFSACDSISTIHFLPTEEHFDHWFNVNGGSKNAHQGKLVQGFWGDLVVLLEHLA